jgi:hypothetical protein
MRLLKTSTIQLEEFIDGRVPTYAILSHQLQLDGEVSFQDMQSGVADKKTGYEKIQKCPELARNDGLTYAWVDTCCIDKTSSAELSEAINSMYRWYQNASVCYAFLAGVPSLGDLYGRVDLSRAQHLVDSWMDFARASRTS